jgi:hypothetical protein
MELTRKNAVAVIKAYAKLLVKQAGEIKPEQFQSLAKMFRQDQKDPVATFKRLLKSEVAKEMIAEELQAMLSDSGVTPHSVIREYLEIKRRAEEIAHANDSVTALNLVKSVNDKFAQMLDMRPEKQRLLEDAEASIDYSEYVIDKSHEYQIEGLEFE